MVFNPNIPRPTDLLSNSQGDLLANNGALNSTFSRNHIPLNVATNNGKHTFVELVFSNPIGSPPVPPLSSGGGTVYSKSVSSKAQLFFSPGSSGNEYQMTATDASNFATFASNTGIGWTFLPGGIIYNFGFVSTPSSSPTSGNVTFSKSYAGTNTLIFIQPWYDGTAPTGADTIYVKNDSITTSQFHWNHSGSSNAVDGFNWFAIGI